MLNLSRGIAFLLFLSLYSSVSAVDSPAVITNEIAWMGTENSSYDEWIELYNNAPDSISIDGWTLKNTDGTLLVNLKGVIPPMGFIS